MPADKPKKLCLSETRVLVIGPNVWGRGDTIEEALIKAGRPRKYVVYVCHFDTRVNEMGDLVYPIGYQPKRILSRGVKARDVFEQPSGNIG